jgi:hypothetical protein
MAFYKVRYSMGPNNTLVYPASIAGVVWTSAAYDANDRVMVGETAATVKTDRKSVSALTPAQAKKLIAAYRASYPTLEELPWLSKGAARSSSGKRGRAR